MKKIYTILVWLAIFSLSLNMNAQNGTYKGKAEAKCPILSLDESIDDAIVILKPVGTGYNLVVDQIDLGGGMMTPIIEIPKVTATPSGANYNLSAPDMNIKIPEIKVSGLTLTNLPVTVKLKNGLVAGNNLTLNIDITSSDFPITIVITYNGTKTEPEYPPFAGDGSFQKPWEIAKLIDWWIYTELTYFCPSCIWGKYAKLLKDMDFGDYQPTEPWRPIGNGHNNAFYGHFDGNGKKLTGLKIKNDPDEYQQFAGLFGFVSSGTVKDLGLVDVEVEYETQVVGVGEIFTGGLVGCLGGDSKISNCFVTGKVKSKSKHGKSYLGGVAGRVSEQSMINDCYATAEVESSSDFYAIAGGIAGFLYSATVKNCYSTGKVRCFSEKNAAAGGLVGEVGESYEESGSTITECAALNPSISCAGEEREYGRIVGKVTNNPIDSLARNAAFNEMINPEGETEWDEEYLVCNGENITKEEINADGTIGGRFLAENGWAIANNSLPGLFNSPVDMPEFLEPNGITSATLSNTITVYPNPTTGEFKVQEFNGSKVQSVELYDVMGKKHDGTKTQIHEAGWSLDISNLSNGIYFLKISTENGIVTKKVIKN